MTQTKTTAETSGALPVNYEQVLNWTITGNRRRMWGMQLLGIILLVISLAIFSAIASTAREMPAAFDFGAVDLLWLIAGLAATFILHELVHGLVMRANGAHPQYGVILKFLAFYATAPGYAFRRNTYLVIALAPLVGLSLLAVGGILAAPSAELAQLLVICAAMNAAGAIGDLWMTGVVLRYPECAYVIDERDGMRIFLPKHD